jgi:hypothetical protein
MRHDFVQEFMLLRPLRFGRLAPLAALAFVQAGVVRAQPPGAPGLYRAQAGPDLASAIELSADGRFRYQLSEGALDEQASGRWTQDADGVHLQTLPRPRAPVWSMEPIGEAKDTPLSLNVTVPGRGGRGLAGVDFRIGFSNGDIQASYTQEDGWSMPPGDSRQPIWLELAEPIHGVVSARFPLPDKRRIAVTILLTPNDIGIADFDDTKVTLTAEGLVLHWRDRDISYARVGKVRRTP